MELCTTLPPKQEFNIDNFLSTVESSESGNPGSKYLGADGTKLPLYESGYEGKIDYRLRQLSHSARELFDACPRLYQLQRLRTTQKSAEDAEKNITFAFGHVIGDGVQRLLQGISEDQVIWEAFCGWHADLDEEIKKSGKSFWSAVIGIQKFVQLRGSGFLDEYELVEYQGRPACELSFRISFPDGFNYRGSVDAVFRHRTTGKILVLELKTTGFKTVNPATYKNSGQAIGYSVVLDHLFPELSSYEVLYLVYKTASLEYEPIPFVKSYLQRALWLRELLLDIETIKLYEEAEVYPMRGHSCVRYFRDCEYLNTCTLPTDQLKAVASEVDFDTKEYQVEVSLMDLLEAQFAKTE